MNQNIVKDMLLISDPSIFKLYKELGTIASLFIGPLFTTALVVEYFTEMKFGEVLKKLVLVTVFMGAFYGLHTKAVDISLKTATETLKKVSPGNLFIKKWYYGKIKTKEKKNWSGIEAFVIPNINDLVATLFFVLSKIFIWLLKLIYSSVYHLTYIFAGLTAILYFLGWTKDAIKGTFQASLWCMILPFVLVAILALVGNSVNEKALLGEFAASSIDNLVWLFGITLLMLITPVITYGMVKGDGIHSAGSKMGAMLVSSGTHAVAAMPMMKRQGRLARTHFNKAKRSLSRIASPKSSNAYKYAGTRNTKNGNRNRYEGIKNSFPKSTSKENLIPKSTQLTPGGNGDKSKSAMKEVVANGARGKIQREKKQLVLKSSNLKQDKSNTQSRTLEVRRNTSNTKSIKREKGGKVELRRLPSKLNKRK